MYGEFIIFQQSNTICLKYFNLAKFTLPAANTIRRRELMSIHNKVIIAFKD